jgi:hypothetical protein
MQDTKEDAVTAKRPSVGDVREDWDTLKEHIATLSDGKLDKDDVAAVRGMARTAPNLVISVLALILAALAMFGVELPEGESTSAEADEAGTGTDTDGE